MDDEREVSEKRKLFIGAMSYSTTDESLCKAFEKFGKIVSGRVMINRDTNASRGFGFVVFETSEAAADALREMNGQSVDGREIRVDFATKKSDAPVVPRSAHTGGPRTNICYDWEQGTCNRGSRCKFEHPELRPKERGGYADDRQRPAPRYDDRRPAAADYRADTRDYRAPDSRAAYREYDSRGSEYRSDYRAAGDYRGGSDYYRAPAPAADYRSADYRGGEYRATGSADYRGASTDYRGASDYRGGDYRGSTSDYRAGGSGDYRASSAADYRGATSADYRGSSSADYRGASSGSSADYRGASSTDYRSGSGAVASDYSRSAGAAAVDTRGDYARSDYSRTSSADYRAPTATDYRASTSDYHRAASDTRPADYSRDTSRGGYGYGATRQ